MSKTKVKEFLLITLGVALVAIGSHFFFSPNNLVSGGVVGISILLKNHIPESIFLLLANTLFLLLGLIVLGKSFFIKTAYATLAMPLIKGLLELLIDNDEVIRVMNFGPNNLIIASIFGGALVGAGLAIVLRNNATTGGVDVLQQIVAKYFKISFAVSLIIIDGLVIILGFYVYGIELGLFGILTMAVTAIVLDYITVAGQSGYTVFIVTTEYEAIRDKVFSKLDRGITKIEVIGAYTDNHKDMIISSISSRQLYDFKKIISEVDPKAFTFITKTHSTHGEGFYGLKEHEWK